MSKLEELQSLLTHKKSKAYYAKRMKISELEVDKLLSQLKARRPVEEQDSDEEESTKIDYENGTLRATKLVTDYPSTPEDIIRLHGIDPKVWKLSQFWSKQKKDKWLVSALFTQVRIEKDLPLQKEVILKELEAYANRVIPKLSPVRVVTRDSDTLLEISIPDLHFGKLAHKEEVGEDYDIKIASNRANTAVDELLKRVNLSTVERILFPIGNDLFNVDNQFRTTTAGTPQDTDTRFHKMVKITYAVLVHNIDKLAAIAPVDIPIVRGNHDDITTFLLGEILAAHYRNEPRVSIDNAFHKRKYYQYYENGFQFTHGDSEKHTELGLIFATERKKLWADTTFRYCQLGHFHKEKKIEYVTVDSFQGFQIEILPSLSGPDAWHNSKGYISNKAAKAFLYHRTKGEIGSYKYTVTEE
jgi:hypothetical protein